MFFAFFSISVAIAQNTMGITITTATTMAAASGNGPLALHMRPCACRCILGRDSFVPGMMHRHNMECFGGHTHPQQPQKIYPLARGLSTIHSMHWIGAQGLMWGTRGPFLPAAAMVCYGCVGHCWPLEADVSTTNCTNSKNCLRKFFFIPT